MEQNMNDRTKPPLYFRDLLMLFVKKIKVLSVVALIAAILGGVFGAFVTSTIVSEYTASIDVSVSSVDDSDILINNLRSGRFAELLLLDKNGLPPKANCNAEDYDRALAAIETFNAVRAERLNKYNELSAYHINDIEGEYKRLETEYLEAFERLKMYKDADGEGYLNNAEHLQMTAKFEEELLAVKAKKDVYYKEYYAPACHKRTQLQTELAILKYEVDQAKKAADDAREKVLAAWRMSSSVVEETERILQYTEYNYFELSTPKIDEKNSNVTVDKGHIKINISVPTKDKDMINKLINAYKLHICDYIEREMEYIANQPDVECVLLTPSIIVVSPEKIDYVIEAVKYAIVAALAASILVYLVFLAKMLINYEINEPKTTETENEQTEKKQPTE